MFDYFYGVEAMQYTFYSVPQLLFTDEKFKGISCEAKLFYGFLLDRAGLSQKNGWYEEDGKVYVYFKLEELCEKLNVGSQKAVKVFNELDVETGIGLIRRKKQGQGKPTKIYVLNFTKYIENDSDNPDFQTCENQKSELCESQVLTCENHKSELSESQVLTFENHKSKVVKITSPDLRKSQVLPISNTNRIILSESYQSNQSGEPSDSHKSHKSEGGDSDMIDMIDLQSERENYLELLKYNIEYEWWTDAAKTGSKYKERLSLVNELLSVMVDVVCSRKPSMRINQEDKPTAVVKSAFLKLGQEHIEYVIDSFEKNTTEIKNPRAYMITSLYNALSTYNHASQADLNHLIADSRGNGSY